MTPAITNPSHPVFHVRGGRRSTVHAVALISLCFALGAGFASQVWSGPATSQAVETSAARA